MLDDKVAIVTGAGQGIGRAIVVEMAQPAGRRGRRRDRNGAAAEETAELARAAGAQALAIECDLRDRDQIEAMVETTVERFGALDVLVNNAGSIESVLTADCAVDTLPEDVWDAVYETNLRAPWLATKFAAPHLRRSTRGPNIVNAGSAASFWPWRAGPPTARPRAASLSSRGSPPSTSARPCAATPTARA